MGKPFISAKQDAAGQWFYWLSSKEESHEVRALCSAMNEGDFKEHLCRLTKGGLPSNYEKYRDAAQRKYQQESTEFELDPPPP